jgi:hypothetical protein
MNTTKHTVVDVLRMAGYLLEDPKRRIKHLVATDGAGHWTETDSPRARCWCLVGAVDACCRKLKVDRDIAMNFLQDLLDITGSRRGLIGEHWDRQTIEAQGEIASKLRAVKGGRRSALSMAYLKVPA